MDADIPSRYLAPVVSKVMKPKYSGSYLAHADYTSGFKISHKYVDELAQELTTSQLISYIKSSYEGDIISTIPTCNCGVTFGNENEYTKCGDCGSVVVKSTERPIESDLWVRPPTDVLALIRPSSLTMLKQVYHKDKLSIIPWLINRNMSTPKQASYIPTLLKANGIERGLNFFVKHFDHILDVLDKHKLYKTSLNKKQITSFRNWRLANRDTIFTDRLPIPSKIAFITEVTSLGIYHDATIKPALDAVVAMANTNNEQNLTTKENRTGKVLDLFSQFYESYIKTHANPKEGWYRQCIFGTLTDFGGRAVITSRTNCSYDQISIPWGFALILFRMHITNKLMQRYETITSEECKEWIYSKVHQWDEELSEIMNELIKESPHDRGIPCLLLRNPSLRRTSIQQMYINEITQDPEVKTIALPLDATKGPNADFDGDQMMLALIHDMVEWESLRYLSSEFDIWDLQTIEKIDTVNDLHSPTISTITNALYSHRETKFYDSHQKMPTTVDLYGEEYADFDKF